MTTYRIQRNDTFSSIARRFYGDSRYWIVLQRANPDLDPRRLQIGQEILVPAVEDVVPDRRGK
jgi:N-acetylmuramoyl-L-alanine amidase